MNKKRSAGNQESTASKNTAYKTGDTFTSKLFVSGINTPICVQLLINQPEFLLGKGDSCDGILGFNGEISKQHCKIVYNKGEYFIIDLGSTNHTFLNQKELAPNKEYRVHPGDQIRLSTSTFLVEEIYSAEG